MYIVIAGIGLVGGELARRLMENKHDVVVVDANRETCEKLYAEAGVIAITGDVARIETLKDAGIEKADVFVAATGSDTANLAGAILAKSLGVPEIIVRMRNPAYESAYKLVGATSITRVTDLMVNQMIIEVEKPEVRRVMTIGGGKADIYSVIIPKGARVAGRTVESIAKSPKFPSTCVFIAVYNRETKELSIPRGPQIIHEKDEILLISPADDISEVTDFLFG
jgi:trk system potassium uptake protein TrkA